VLSSKFSPLNLLSKYRSIDVVHSWSAIIFALLLSLFITLRLWNLTAYSLWGGEAFTMIGVQQSWSDMFAYIVRDIVHPPLFYILLKLWVEIGGDSLLWLKLFTVIPGIVVVVPLVQLCRNLNLRLPVINFVVLLVAVNGFLVHYAQELRMYSLFTFLTMCSFWLFVRFFNSTGHVTRKLVLLTLVNLLTIYTHYYGWIVVGLEFLFLLIWQRRRMLPFGLSILFLLLCFAPWAYLVVQQARAIGGLESNLDWIPRPDLNYLLNLYVTFNGPLGSRYVKLMGLFLFGLPLAFWAWQLLRSDFKTSQDQLIKFSWLSLLAFMPVLVLFLISQKMAQAVFIDRYFIFIAVPYLLLVAVSVSHLKPMWVRNLFITAIAAWSLTAGINDLVTNRMAWESPQLGSRVEWHDLAQRMVLSEEESTGPIKVYTLTVYSRGNRTGDWAISTSLKYHLDALDDNRFEMVYARDIYTVLDQTNEEHFWVAYFELEEFPQRSQREVLIQNGYLVGDEISYKERNNKIVLLPVWRN
jgi:hypothetical protein